MGIDDRVLVHPDLDGGEIAFDGVEAGVEVVEPHGQAGLKVLEVLLEYPECRHRRSPFLNLLSSRRRDSA